MACAESVVRKYDKYNCGIAVNILRKYDFVTCRLISTGI